MAKIADDISQVNQRVLDLVKLPATKRCALQWGLVKNPERDTVARFLTSKVHY